MSGRIPLSARMALTPPLSPRQKRRVLRESDDNSGGQTIEQYIYRTDAYRCTSLGAPLPLPIVRASLALDDSLRQVLQSLMPQIRAEINAAIHDQYTVDFCRTWKAKYPRGEIVHLTLCVQVYEGSEPSTRWPDLRTALVALLNASGFQSIQVEIVDESRAFMPSIYPQPPYKGSIRVYENLREGIIDLLMSTLGKTWNCMSLFRSGASEEESAPTIVIFVEPFAFQDWQWLEATINEMVKPQLPPGVELPVEFLPGRLSDLTGKDLTNQLFGEDASLPKMGSSIENKGGDSSGTIGGFVRLRLGNETHQGILTNHHVIRPDLDKSSAQLLSMQGYAYAPNHSDRPIIHCPSSEDLDATRKAMNLRLESTMGEITNFEAMNEKRLMKGQEIVPRVEELRQIQVKIASKLQERLTKVNTILPLNMGSVLVSSGDIVSSDRAIVDWAFVELPSDHGFKFLNALPFVDDPQLTNKHYEGAGTYKAPEKGGNPLIATEFGRMIKGNWYLKQGRTSGITSGMCNGVEAEINRTGSVRYTETGKEYPLGKNTTRELIILSYEKLGHGPNAPMFQDELSAPGDSGAFVIDTEGRVCGLLYGEHTGLCGGSGRQDRGAGLVTDMIDVLASIAKKTSFRDSQGKWVVGEVTLPS